ncbi:MAG: cell division protein FtsQ/DivIB [Bacilli bacterium]
MNNARNVVGLEERYPKLRRTRRRKANRQLLIYLLILFILLILLVYSQSTFARVNTLDWEGNVYITTEELTEVVHPLNLHETYWLGSTTELESAIAALPGVKQVNVSKSFPNRWVVRIEEIPPVAYVVKGTTYTPLLADGKLQSNRTVNAIQTEGPIVRGINAERDHKMLEHLARELSQLDPTLLRLISEIYCNENKQDEFEIRMLMKDRRTVYALATTLSKLLPDYPEIASRLPQGVSGVVHLKESVFFEPIGQKAQDKKEQPQ